LNPSSTPTSTPPLQLPVNLPGGEVELGGASSFPVYQPDTPDRPSTPGPGNIAGGLSSGGRATSNGFNPQTSTPPTKLRATNDQATNDHEVAASKPKRTEASPPAASRRSNQRNSTSKANPTDRGGQQKRRVINVSSGVERSNKGKDRDDGSDTESESD
jgi:hypothetical protein